MIEHKRNLRSSDVGPIIKQGGDYTFQQQATVSNNLPRDFKEINDFEAFWRKTKGFYKDKALVRVLSLSSVLSLVFAFMSNYAIAVYCCNLLFCCFNFDSFLYLSLRPLFSLNFLFYRSIHIHLVIGNILCLFILVPILTLCVSLSAEFKL